jgi:hypothetical protein
MPERRSDKPGPKKLRFRAVFTADALSADALATAARLFARWAVRALGARESEASAPAGRRPGPQTEHADGATGLGPRISVGGGQG